MKTIWKTMYCLAVIALCARAQTITASLEGTVRDSSGAVIAGATARVINVATNAVVELKTNSEGRFLAPPLQPGTYSVTVEAAGFKKAQQKDLTLQVAQAARIEIVMEIGSQTEAITVSADAALLDATTSAVGQVVQRQTIVNLPLNQRNPFSLIMLVPGAVGTVGNDAVGGNFSVNGGRSGQNDILLDGVSSTPVSDNSNRLTIFPSVDAVQEFRVQTNNFSAEFGASGGGIINLIYKSGSNQLHGSAFEFLRNSVLDANSFFSNQRGLPLGSFKRNQFGASGGGPVEIPKLYNGKNKTFIFADYEGLRQRSAGSTTLTVPTVPERTGDFSQLLDKNGKLVPIYDPTTTVRTANGFARQPVPGNVIPLSLLNSVSMKVAQLYPLPNQAGTGLGANNFYAAGAGPITQDQYDIKVDHSLTDRQRLSFRWSKRYTYSEPAHFFADNLLPGQTGGTTDYRNTGAVANYDLTKSATWFMNIRYGLSRTYRFSGILGLGFDPTTLGLPLYMKTNADQLSMPAFAPNGYSLIGNGNAAGIGPTALEAHSLQVSNTKVLTRHTLKFGADIRVYRNNTDQTGDASGNFSFAKGMTGGPDPSVASSSATGDGFAALLFGYGSGDMIKNYKVVSTQSEYYAMYLQDDWKASSRLTLNFGLRYDLTIPRHERYNRGVNLDPLVASPLAGPSGLANLRGGVQYLGVGGNPTKQFNTEWTDFGPRAGFAYQASAKTVIRGAYGVFWTPTVQAAAQTIAQPGYTSTTNYYGTLDGYTPNDKISNPFPNGYMPVTGSAQGLLTLIGQSVTAPHRDTRNPYLLSWNFGMQREIKGMVIDATYVGNHGVALSDNAGGNLNQLPVQYMSLGQQLLNQVPNPFYNLISTGPLSGKTVAQNYLLRPYPQFSAFRDINPSVGSSIYHSFQLKAEKRFASGLGFLLAYTNQKAIDNTSQSGTNFSGSSTAQNWYDFASERSVAVFDVSQRLVMSYVYELPIGRGRALGKGMNRLLDAALGGWQINGITTFQTGTPLLLTAANNANAFNDGLRPNNNGTSALLGGSIIDRVNSHQYFNTSVFSQPAAFTFGNTSRTLPDVRSPGIRNLDLSMFKNFKPMETLTLQFRAEAFNATNTVQFSAPGTSLNTPSTFGVIAGQANSPRQIQFGLKLLF
jgi:hypothetical protein